MRRTAGREGGQRREKGGRISEAIEAAAALAAASGIRTRRRETREKQNLHTKKGRIGKRRNKKEEIERKTHNSYTKREKTKEREGTKNNG